MGTISVELRPRRFIGVGANLASVMWREQIAAIQARAVERIVATSAP
jgi:hypothetical protein